MSRLYSLLSRFLRWAEAADYYCETQEQFYGPSTNFNLPEKLRNCAYGEIRRAARRADAARRRLGKLHDAIEALAAHGIVVRVSPYVASLIDSEVEASLFDAVIIVNDEDSGG